MNSRLTQKVRSTGESGAAVAENETDKAVSDVPFVDGLRTLKTEKLLKPRGKSGEKEHPGVKVEIAIPEVNDLGIAVATLLTLVDNSTEKALEVFNSALDRAATQKVYDATFGDEIKIRAMIRTMTAAGVDEVTAEATARALFAKVKGTTE